jgi:uncharacterized protein (TIGR02466 family)
VAAIFDENKPVAERPDTPNTKELMRAASERHRRGLLDEADSLYGQVLAQAPDHARALMLRGVLERERGGLAASLGLLRQAEQAAGRDAEITGQLAISYMAANDLGKADEALRRALQIDPAAAQVLANLGALLQHRGLLAEAVQMHRRYLELVPDDIEVQCNLANALADLGDGDGALAHLDAMIGQHPGDPLLLATRGAVLCSMDRFAAALEPLGQALSINPSDDMALINLAFAHRRLANPAAAIEALQAAIRFNPDNARATSDLANLHLAAGRAAEACAVCERFLLYHRGERLVLGTYPYALRAAGRVAAADRLLDYGRWVSVVDIDREDAAGTGAFHQTLAAALQEHPTLIANPVSKSTYGGAQTGELDAAAVPGLAALVERIDAQIANYVTRCTGEHLLDHPAMTGASQRWSLRIWATVLRAGGHQSAHLHPLAWLSGVYYVSLPDDMTAQDAWAGQLEFGQPPKRIGVQGETWPVEPRVGRLVLFPSYYYHGTRPFESNAPRISIAFDVMPMPA